MISLTTTQINAWIVAFFFPLARILGVLVASPPFNNQALNTRTRLILGLAITFAIAPAQMGVPYNIGGLLALLTMIPLPIVKEMLFTAQPLPSDQAFNLGIVNYVKPAGEIEAFVMDIANRIATNSPLSIGVMKNALHLLSSAHSVSPDLFERIQGMRRIVYDSDDYQEGIRAFREKRKPSFPGK